MQETFPLLSERYEEITSAPLPKGQREHADNLMSSILTSMGPFYRLPDAIFFRFFKAIGDSEQNPTSVAFFFGDLCLMR